MSMMRRIKMLVCVGLCTLSLDKAVTNASAAPAGLESALIQICSDEDDGSRNMSSRARKMHDLLFSTRIKSMKEYDDDSSVRFSSRRFTSGKQTGSDATSSIVSSTLNVNDGLPGPSVDSNTSSTTSAPENVDNGATTTAKSSGERPAEPLPDDNAEDGSNEREFGSRGGKRAVEHRPGFFMNPKLHAMMMSVYLRQWRQSAINKEGIQNENIEPRQRFSNVLQLVRGVNAFTNRNGHQSIRVSPVETNMPESSEGPHGKSDPKIIVAHGSSAENENTSWWNKQARVKKMAMVIGCVVAVAGLFGGVIHVVTSSATDDSSSTLSVDSFAPTAFPTSNPTEFIEVVIQESPSLTPSHHPTAVPTEGPTIIESVTSSPSKIPTVHPTSAPTDSPSASPTDGPTNSPTSLPTESPSKDPTSGPSSVPTNTPSETPTNSPTDEPTDAPSASPTHGPTTTPTTIPTHEPTTTPSESPTHRPSATPSKSPTQDPTELPSSVPTSRPTLIPTEMPTGVPSENPTAAPTRPTASPTALPSFSPTESPTRNGTFVGDVTVSQVSEIFPHRGIIGDIIFAGEYENGELALSNHFPYLAEIQGSIIIDGVETTSVSFPELVTVHGGSIVIRDCVFLQSVAFDRLEFIEGSGVSQRSLSVAGENVVDAGSLHIEGNEQVDSLSLPNLKSAGSVTISTNSALKEFDLLVLELVDIFVHISGNEVLETIRVPALNFIGSDFFVQDNPALHTVLLHDNYVVMGISTGLVRWTPHVGNVDISSVPDAPFLPERVIGDISISDLVVPDGFSHHDGDDSFLIFPYLREVQGDITIKQTILRSQRFVLFPKLRRIDGAISIEQNCDVAPHAAPFFPRLHEVEGSINCQSNAMVDISFPELHSITNGDVIIFANELLENINFPELATFGGSIFTNFSVYDNLGLENIHIPELQTVDGTFSALGTDNLTTVELGSLDTVSGDLLISSGRSVLGALALGHDYTVGGRIDLPHVHRYIGDVTVRPSSKYTFERHVIVGDIDVDEDFSGDLNSTAVLPGLQEVHGNLHIRNTNATRVFFDDLEVVNGGSIVASDNAILTEIGFHNLVEIIVSSNEFSGRRLTGSTDGKFDIHSNFNLTKITFEKLYTANAVEIHGNDALRDVEMPSFTGCVTDFILSGNDVLESFQIPNLKNVGGTLELASNDALTNVSFPTLSEVNNVAIEVNGALQTVAMSNLQTTDGNFEIYNCTALADVNLESLANVGGALVIVSDDHLPSVDLGNLAHVVGTLNIDDSLELPAWPDTFWYFVQRLCRAPFGDLSACSDDIILEALGIYICEEGLSLFTSCNGDITLNTPCQIINCEDVTGKITISENFAGDIVQPFVKSIGQGLSSYNNAFVLHPDAAVNVINMPALEVVHASFQITFSEAPTVINALSLKTISGNFLIQYLSALVAVNMPALETSGSSFHIFDNDALTVLNMPSLQTVFSTFRILRNSALATISLPSFAIADSTVEIHSNPALITIDMPILETIESNIEISENANLTTIRMPSFVGLVSNPSWNSGDTHLEIYKNKHLVSIDMPALAVSGDVDIYENDALRTIEMIALVEIPNDGLHIYKNKVLATIRMPVLKTLLGGTLANINIYENDALSIIDFPALESCWVIKIYENPAMMSFDLPVLTGVNGMEIYTNRNLIAIDMPALGVMEGLEIYNNQALTIVRMQGLEASPDSCSYRTCKINIYANIALTMIDFPALTSFSGNMNIYENPVLITFEFPALTSFSSSMNSYDGIFNIYNNSALSSIRMPVLRAFASGFAAQINVHDNEALSSIDFSALESCTNMNIYQNPALIALDLPALAELEGTFKIYKNGKLFSISMPVLTISRELHIFNNQALSTVRMPVLKTIAVSSSYSDSISIYENDALSVIDLSSLERFSNMKIYSNPELISLDLPALIELTSGNDFPTYQSGGVQIYYQYASVMIYNNTALTSIRMPILATYQETTNHISGTFKIYGNAALSIVDFSALERCREMNIYENPALIFFELPALTEIISALDIYSNSGLTTISLPNLETVGTVNIQDNSEDMTEENIIIPAQCRNGC